MTMDFDDLTKKQDEIIDYLNNMYAAGYKMSLLFVTDVIRNGSYLFYNSDAKEFLEDAYDVMNIEQGHYFDGFVSRKKQMLPPLIDLEDRRS
jgi:manganese-dependent inorganic pyrophosphatase